MKHRALCFSFLVASWLASVAAHPADAASPADSAASPAEAAVSPAEAAASPAEAAASPAEAAASSAEAAASPVDAAASPALAVTATAGTDPDLPAVGATVAPERRRELGTFVLQFENDLFTGTDQHYTNGIRFSWLTPEEPRNAAESTGRKALRAVARDDGRSGRVSETRYSAALGQDIYTPEDKDRRDLIVEDRPYAGWLYGALSLHTVTARGGERKDLESVELQLGVVGPWALGKQAQDLIHEVRLLDKFKGWSNQLENEPGLLLLYERKWRLFNPLDLEPLGLPFLHFDAVPHAGGSLGNVLTHANIGAAARLGWRLPDDFGPPSLIQGLMPTDRPHDKLISFYAFASTEGRFVVHDIFLDGNTFRDSHSVDKNRWVGDVAVGAVLVLWRFQLSYSTAVRSREFKGQKHDSRFGSLSISYQGYWAAD